jgi:hypothetical protein
MAVPARRISKLAALLIDRQLQWPKYPIMIISRLQILANVFSPLAPLARSNT